MFTCLLALLAETFPITDLSTVDGCEFLGQMAKWSNPLGASNPLAIKAVGDGSNGPISKNSWRRLDLDQGIKDNNSIGEHSTRPPD
jgi:hypothetical protein